MREKLAKGILDGQLEVDLTLELDALPQWVTDPSADAPHMQIPINDILVHESD
jgi:hypothetical protein